MPGTILIATHSAANRQTLANALRDQYITAGAATGDEALAILEREGASIAAILLDADMPGAGGFDTLRRIRADESNAQIPIIMLTGSSDERLRMKLLSLGANDYLLKPYNSEIVLHCLNNHIALREASAKLSALERDRLTGLYSREAFFARALELTRAHEPGYYIMACFDIDRFKVINDQYGTHKGDEVLRHIAGVFQRGFSANGGICCRVAADDFAVLYPTEFAQSAEIARIRTQASHIEGIALPIVFRIGRYVVDDLTLSPSSMYDRAMLAADSVKGRYDTQIGSYNEAMRSRLLQEQEIVNEMADALIKGQFEVWYQPQYNHSTGALLGAEALVRWRRPDRGLVSPAVFIPIFEQNGFIYELDKFVWRQVCINLRDWLDRGLSPMPVSVNISRYDIFRFDLVDIIHELLAQYSIPVELLRLEITESAFTQSAAQIISVVQKLLDAGFTVEIDDFGSGYSSLNTLKDVPAQVIKLDMRFLQSSNSVRGGNIVESVVRMAKWLNMTVIAEGVETVEQADFLNSIGCSFVQGFLYARPMTAKEYEGRCDGVEREGVLRPLETVKNLDNNAFWDPKSMDTLIFNSYVGGACIFEYHDGEVQLLRVNAKYLEEFGGRISAQDVFQYTLTDFMDGENRKLLAENIERAIATGGESACETHVYGLYGQAKNLYIRANVRMIARAGDRYLLYCSINNVTAQREAEQSERRNTAQLNAITANINGGVTAAVTDGNDVRFLYMNDNYLEQLGYTREQFDAEAPNVYELIHPDDRARVAGEAETHSRERTPFSVTYRIIRRDGAVRWMRSNIAIITLPEGGDAPVQLSVANDVTELVEAERRADALAEQMMYIMAGVNQGITAVVNRDGELSFLFANDRYFDMLGYTREQYEAEVSGSFLTVISADRERVKRESAAITASGKPGTIEYRAMRRDGNVTWMRAAISVCRFSGIDEPVQLGILNDINAEKLAELDERKTAQQQNALLDNLPCGAALYEYDGETLSVVHRNRRYWELMATAPGDNDNADATEAIHPDDRAVLINEITAALVQKRDAACDIRVRRGDGTYRAFHCMGRIICGQGERFSLYTTYTPLSGEAISLRESLPFVLSAIMESTTDMAFAKDKDFKYICASRTFARTVGLDNERTIIGKTDFDIYPEEYARKYRADDMALLEGGKPIIDMVEPIPSDDGVTHYSNTSKYLLRDTSGAVIGIYGLGRDITKAIETDSQLQFLNDSIPGGLAIYEIRGHSVRISYCNDGFCRLFNATREAFDSTQAVDPLEWVFDEDKPVLLAQLEGLVNNGTPISHIFRVHLVGGGYKWVHHKAVAARRNDGVLYATSVLLDVTSQQEVLERLRVSEEENRLALMHSGNIVCRYTIAERTLSMSPEAAAKIGRPSIIENVPYGPVAAGNISEESQRAYIAFFEEIMRGGKSGQTLFRTKLANGWRWMEGHFSTIFSSAGEPVSAVISYIDATERLEKEAIYNKWQQSLQNKPVESYSLYRCNISRNTSFDSEEGRLLHVAYREGPLTFDERTVEFVEQCVYEEDRERYIAFLRSDALLAAYYRGTHTMTHDFREKLTGSGYRWLRLTVDLFEYPTSTDVMAHLFFENIDDEKRAELMTIERAETDVLTGVLNRATFETRVNQEIRTSRPDARHALLMLDIDGFKQVNDALGHAAGDQALTEIARGLRSVLRRGDLVGRLGGDEFLVFLADIPNDVVAANKALHICAITRRTFSAQVHISGSVGIAIAPHDGNDFDALYHKVDTALYYVKGLGKDNYAFYHSDMETAAPVLDGVANDRNDPSRKRRILIVDDNRIDFEMLAKIFGGEFVIDKAADGNAALIRLRHYGTAISAVLLDLMMPGMDGFSVLAKMQSSAELQTIPVIVVTGAVDRDTCLRVMNAGAADFVTKPVDAQLLQIRVKAAIARSENDRARAKSCMREVHSGETARYKTALSDAGIAVIEHDWISGGFTYDPSLGQYLLGNYDERKLWHILLSDMVADTLTVQKLQRFVHDLAEDDARASASIMVKLRNPAKKLHRFRVNVRKILNEFQLTSKLIITLLDLDIDKS